MGFHPSFLKLFMHFKRLAIVLACWLLSVTLIFTFLWVGPVLPLWLPDLIGVSLWFVTTMVSLMQLFVSFLGLYLAFFGTPEKNQKNQLSSLKVVT